MIYIRWWNGHLSPNDHLSPPSCSDVERLHINSAAPANKEPDLNPADTSQLKNAPGQQKRPIEEYKLEKDLQSACDVLDAAEQALPKLHLVVLGHVDAGKSTLMGRLLHDLG